MPRGWFTLAFGVSLSVAVLGYLQAGPVARLRAMTGQRLPEAGSYDASRLATFLRAVDHQLYRQQLICDLVFAVALGSGLSVVLDGTLAEALASPDRYRYLLTVPLVGAACDLGEDAFLLSLLSRTEAGLDLPWARVLSARILTTGKYLFTGASLILILVGCVALALRGAAGWTPGALPLLVLFCALLVGFHTVLALSAIPELASVGIRFGVGAVAIASAPAFLTWLGGPIGWRTAVRLMGLSPIPVGRILVWGGPFVAAILILLTVAWAFPGMRRRVADPRFIGMSPLAVGQKILAIAVATVFLEEILFRAILLASWEAAGESIALAVAASSVTFGLWHVGPAIRDSDRRRPAAADGPSPASAQARGGLVASRVGATILAMTIVGVLFCWLRIASGSLWTPVIVHLSANSAGVVFSAMAGRRSDQART